MGKRGYLILFIIVAGLAAALFFAVCGASVSVVKYEGRGEGVDGVDRGVSLIVDGRYDEAASVFKAALKSKPDDPELLNYLGISRFNAGEYSGALRAFNDALKADPSFARAHHNLGLTYHAMGLYYHALENYEHVINMGADDAQLHYHMGLTEMALKDWAGAVESLERAIVMGEVRSPESDEMLRECRRYLDYAKGMAGGY